jgi:hypothetical protein
VSLRRWLCQLVALCFVIRALVPLGYMPDLNSAHDGTFKLVICTSTGLQVVAIGDDGQPISDPATSHAKGDCPFGGLPQLGQLSSPAAAISAIVAPSQDAAFSFRPPRAPVWRIGPSAGSRAPPSFA